MSSLGSRQKLDRLPDGYRVNKRPLIRPAIASPYTNAKQAKVVYISAHTPFVSAVKRVRKLQQQIIKRSLGKVSLLDDEPGSGKKPLSDAQKLKNVSAKEQNPEPVYLKGTGKAIERVLNLAMYFQGQDDCRVSLKTYSVAAVDDLERCPEGKGSTGPDDPTTVEHRDEEMDRQTSAGVNQTLDVPDSRIRWISGMEVAVTLK